MSDNQSYIWELEDRIDRLQEALDEIATQALPSEFDDEQRRLADYETGYAMCVMVARAAKREISGDA